MRGGILDLYPPGGEPIRLDFFGDTLESIRAFDPETQRTAARREEVQLLPMSEMALTPEVHSAFRQRYVALFGPVTGDDPLYESISAGRQHQGMEHWLPLFQERLVPLFDYLPMRRGQRSIRWSTMRAASGSSRSPTITMRARRRSSARRSARRLIIQCRPRACS